MRELTPLQKQVLEELTWNARLKVEELARRLRVKSHSVRYALQSLERYLDLKPVCWTDPFRQGQTSFLVFLSVNCPSAHVLKRFSQYLIGLSEVHFLASVIGKHQFVINIFARGLEGLLVTLENLDGQFGDIIIDKEISTLTHLVFFTPCLAQPVGDSRKQMGFMPTAAQVDLDELDRKVIELLRDDPIAPLGKLARACGVPTSTLDYRFERLIKSGIIIGFGYAYNDLRAGYHPGIISVSTGGLSSKLFDAFGKFGRSHPNCSWVAHAIGHWDISIGVAVGDLRELEFIIQRIHEIGGSSIREVQVYTVNEWLKG